MVGTVEFAAGGYAFIKGVFQYSAGVMALPGFRIERVRFASPVKLAQGFERAAAVMKARGRPLTAFCACELRSPAPFTDEGFKAFNEIYAGTLADWGILQDGVNPVARSNVCPAVEPPEEPSFHAFSFTVEAPGAPRSFVIAGSGECPEGMPNYRDHIVAKGDLSPAGISTKARWVLSEMERRLGAVGAAWQDTTAVQLYTVHDIYPFLEAELARRGVLRHGLTWHFNRPPILDIEYEMDCRAVHAEQVLAA
jgi:hypothetical protein